MKIKETKAEDMRQNACGVVGTVSLFVPCTARCSEG